MLEVGDAWVSLAGEWHAFPVLPRFRFHIALTINVATMEKNASE